MALPAKRPNRRNSPSDPSLDNLYTDYLASTVTTRFALNIVVDCANGSATEVAPRLFERLGPHVDWIGYAPNGRNINLNSGSLHLENLRQRVLERTPTSA